MEKLAIYLALNGSKYCKQGNQYTQQRVAIPYTVEEAFSDAQACYRLGVRHFHVHSRGLDGAHYMDVAWYHEFGTVMRERYADVSLCYATSRAGAMAQLIRDSAEEMRSHHVIPATAILQSELKRAGYLHSLSDKLLPDYLTAFTATEVKMLAGDLETGHVHETLTSELTAQFVHEIVALSKAKRVGQEIEITTPESLAILDDYHPQIKWGSKPSIMFLPGFTRSFPFSPSLLDKQLARARACLDALGGGMITLGRVLHEQEDSIAARQEYLAYALRSPYVDAVRVGIEDGPFWGDQVLSNEALTYNTLQFIQYLGG